MIGFSELLIAFLAAGLGSVGFSILLGCPHKSLISAGLLGGLGYTLYVLLYSLGCNNLTALVFSCMVTGLAAGELAIHLKMVTTVFITIAIVPFVPGYGLYHCAELLGAGENAAGLAAGIDAMMSIVMIVLGTTIGSFVSRFIHRKKRSH